jgi:DNA-directed RNA polymerase specialized sigma24 family protein
MAGFPSTRWSLIRAHGGDEAQRRASFAELVRRYQPAIRAYLRARLPAGQADDAMQAFLLQSFEHDWFARADPALGSFRAFLLLMLRRHAQRWRERAAPVGEELAEVGGSSPVDDPERAFDARFLLTLTADAVSRLRAVYADRGRGALVEVLLPLLTEPPGPGDLVAAAAGLGMPPNTLAVELRRFRARLADTMRELLADLCVDAETAERDWQALRLSSKARPR